jgi:hypothetical protein
MGTKADTIANLKQEYTWWSDLIERSDGGLAGSNPERTLKDTIAHLMAWQQRSIARMEAAVYHHEPEYNLWPEEMETDDDSSLIAINAWIYTYFKDWSWEEVCKAWKIGFGRLISLSEEASDTDLLPTGKYAWLDGYALLEVVSGSAEHHREHRADFGG